MCQTHLDKLQIIDILEENFYDMQNLTPEEQSMFDDREYAMELMLSPLLNLVKEDIKHIEKETNKVKIYPIQKSRFNNDDRTKYTYDQCVIENIGDNAKKDYEDNFQYIQNDNYILLGELGKPDPPPINQALKKGFQNMLINNPT